MGVKYFIEHLNGSVAFNPLTDKLIFDASIRPTDVIPGDDSFNSIFTTSIEALNGPYAGHWITLTGNVAVPNLATTNFQFLSGGRWLIGDNTAGRTNDSNANTLVGTGYADAFAGLAGNDSMTGKGGDDFFYQTEQQSSLGDDTIAGGAGVDSVIYDEAQTALVANLATGTVSGGSVSGDSAHLTGVENLFGGGLDDTITGSGGANLLMGRLGNDVISGGGGNDTVVGEAGNDVLAGGAGTDWTWFDWDASAVILNLATGRAASATGGNDTLSGIENVLGSAYNDKLTGSNAANYLSGSNGSDVLNGGGGIDTLDGGAGSDAINSGPGIDTVYGSGTNPYFNLTATGGNDRFVFTSLSGGEDYIYGFDARLGGRNDTIDLRGIFDGLGYTGTTPLADGYLILTESTLGGQAGVADAEIWIDPTHDGNLSDAVALARIFDVTLATLQAGADAYFISQ